MTRAPLPALHPTPLLLCPLLSSDPLCLLCSLFPSPNSTSFLLCLTETPDLSHSTNTIFGAWEF